MRQRVAGILVIVGLILGWACLTTLVIRQTVMLSARVPDYALTALKNPTVRSAASDLIARSAQAKYQPLAQIPTTQLKDAIDSALSQPAVADEFANAALQIQQHLLGLNDQPIVLGGPGLTAAVAQIIAPQNPSEQQVIDKLPLSYTLESASIPSFGTYFRLNNGIFHVTLFSSALLLGLSLFIATKKSKILRRIGIGLVGLSVVEVVLFGFVPKYVLSHVHSGPAQIVAGLLTASTGGIEAIYLMVFGAGLALTAISLIM